jgi:hypothetical protein
MSIWYTSGSSIIGQSHISTNTPCQDKHQIRTSLNGEWIAIAICDGAGSAEFSEQGATITSSYFCSELIRLSEQLQTRAPGGWINDFVISCVLNVRESLRSAAGIDDLRGYHCTLVSALLGPTGGFAIHIGDGAIFGGTFNSDLNNKSTELNSNFFISKPENGEYANETFFITEGNWIKHLRITPLPALSWFVACTDGGASLLLDNDLTVKPKFLAPFLEKQINDKFVNKNYINEILSDPQANKLTADDKTIVVAVRNIESIIKHSIQFTPVEPTAASRLKTELEQRLLKDTNPPSNNITNPGTEGTLEVEAKKKHKNPTRLSRLTSGFSLLFILLTVLTTITILAVYYLSPNFKNFSSTVFSPGWKNGKETTTKPQETMPITTRPSEEKKEISEQ